jgi:flagellar hook-length control protein FliK
MAMTTTAVKGVGNIISSVSSQVGNVAAKATEESFQTVWSSQAGSGKTDSQTQSKTRTDDKAATKAKPGDELRAKDSSRKNVRTEDKNQTDTDERTDEPEGEGLEAAMEVIAAAVTDLEQQIADTFDISVEDVQNLMADMDLQPADILQPENLSNLLLEAGGVQDSMELLTDGELYADYQMLMEQGKEAVEQIGAQLEISPEQVLQTVDAAKMPAVEQTAEKPIVEVTVETEDAEPTVQVQDVVNTQEVQQTEDNQNNAGQTDSRSSEHESKDEGKGEANGNLVLQTIRDAAFEPQTENVQNTAVSSDVDTQEVMQQIMDYMKVQVKPDMSSLEMQLHPASLGTLQIQVAAKGGVLTANFVTQNEAVKAALESQMIQLKESFEEQGVKVEAIEVTVQTHQFEQNLEQGRGRQPQETEGRRVRTRRITLGGTEESDIPEELDEQDKLTAQMMAANGNTVDYTA